MGTERVVMETNVETDHCNVDLQRSAERLLEAAMDYFEAHKRATGGAAVVWLKDTAGRMVVLTRGEYRDTLMRNIDRLIPDRGFIKPYGDES